MNTEEGTELVRRLVVNIAPMGQMFSIDRLSAEFALYSHGETLAQVFRMDSDQRVIEQFSSFLTVEELSNQKNTVKGTFLFHNIDAPYDTALAAQRERLPSCTLSTELNASWKSGVEAVVSQFRDEVRELQEQMLALQDKVAKELKSGRAKSERIKSRTSVERPREHDRDDSKRGRDGGGRDRGGSGDRERDAAKKRSKKKSTKKDWCHKCDVPQATVVQGNCYICGEDTHTVDRCPYRSGGCKYCGRYDHNDSECRSEEVTCVFCRGIGHSRLRCKELMHCDECHRPGHSSRHCIVLRKCDKCMHYGHRPQMCPRNNNGGGGGRRY